MHIVHLVVSTAFAGVEQHVACLASTEAEAGHHVEVVGDAGSSMQRSVGPGVVVHPAPTITAARRALAELTEPPTVVHAHMTAAELAAVSAVPRMPVIATRHFAAPRGASPARRFALRQVRRRLAAQISVSQHVAAAIGEASTVVHSGVPDRPAAPRDGARSIVVLGRLESEKNVELALGAFAASGLAGRGWTLDVVGAGARRTALDARAASLAVAPSVHFHGHLDDPTRALERAAVLLAPSAHEALGLAVLEAMAVGLPVIATRSGGHLETVGSCRPDLTFAPDDVAAAAALLRRVAEDEDWSSLAGADLRVFQRRHFTLTRQQIETESVYAGVLT